MLKILQITLYSLLPLAGIFFFGWDWRQVIILYWLENIAVGVATVINIISAPAGTPHYAPGEKPNNAEFSINGKPVDMNSSVAKYILAGFFALHYGGFTFVHGIFVFALASGAFNMDGSAPTAIALPDISTMLWTWLGMTVAQIVLLWQQRYDSNLQQLSLSMRFTSPYKRIIALHFAIIIGAFVIGMLDLPSIAAVILVVMHALLSFSSFGKAAPQPAVATVPANTQNQ